jgi:hypothetical protein
MAVKSMPWRQDFYQTIGMVNDVNLNDMQQWLDALKKIVLIIQAIFDANPDYTKLLV